MGIEGIKAIHSDELIYHPDRVIYPLKRVGDKGEGRWSRISWVEALDIMAERFGEIKKKYGPEAICTIRGCGHKDTASYASFLFSHVIGTPNLMDINRQCNWPTVIGEMVTYGEGLLTERSADYLRSKCILIWGANPKHNRPPQDREIFLAQRNGAKIIVIDPRPPEGMGPGGRPVDLWLRVKPGTDCYLALAIINTIINEKLYDEDFVNNWCIGFEELRRHIQKYTLNEAEKVTWVPQQKIVEAARLFSTIKPSSIHSRLGAGAQHVNATQTSRAIAIIASLAGNIDVPGGNLISDDLGGFRHQRSMAQFPIFPPGIEQKRYGADKYPFLCSAKGKMDFFLSRRQAHGPDCLEAMLEGRIKAFYIPGCNIVLSESNSRKVWRALSNLDFLVVAELFMTPTAELADLVLPAAHFLETELPLRAYQRMGPMVYNYILAARKVVEPRGECWDDRKIVIELAKRMGVQIPWDNLDDFNDWTLKDVGIIFGELQNRKGQQLEFPIGYEKYKRAGFKTPSGKIELYSESFKSLGYDPLPSYVEPFQGHLDLDVLKDYPLILISHRDIHYIHSEFRQLSSIRRDYPDPLIELNPETARELAVEEGDIIYVETPSFRDRMAGKARFVSDLHPKVVSCVSHWWFPEKRGPERGCYDSNINAIISYGPPHDPVTGAHQARSIPCRVVKK